MFYAQNERKISINLKKTTKSNVYRCCVALIFNNMKIYLVSTNDRVSYDEYDAVVVIAKSIEDAILIAKESCNNFKNNLAVSDIGTAHDDQFRGEVLASYNAA